MPLIHIVLFKPKADTTPENVQETATAMKAMLGVVPGLLEIEVGEGIPETAQRAKGFTFGLYSKLERRDQLPGYAVHDAHKIVLGFREKYFDDALAFDFEI